MKFSADSSYTYQHVGVPTVFPGRWKVIDQNLILIQSAHAEESQSDPLSALDLQPRVFGGGLGQSADVSFDLSAAANVTVRVHDVFGDIVRTILRDTPMAPGRNSLSWDGLRDDKSLVPPGLYVIRAQTGTAIAGTGCFVLASGTEQSDVPDSLLGYSDDAGLELLPGGLGAVEMRVAAFSITRSELLVFVNRRLVFLDGQLVESLSDDAASPVVWRRVP